MNYEPPKARLADVEVDAYRDSAALARGTVYLLYAQMAVTILAIWSGALERHTLTGLSNGVFDSDADSAAAADASDTRQAMVGVAQLALFISAGIFCLRWIHRMSHNARIRATHMQFTPGWSIGWYFVPIVYWWKPYQAMKEIWQKSVEQAEARGVEALGLLGLWWTLWIASSLLSNASLRLTMRITDLNGALIANAFTLASDVVQVPLCLVFILMVKKLTAMQEYAHDNPPLANPATNFPGGNW